MRHTESLKDNRAFRRLYSKGKCAAAKNVAVYWRKRPGKQNRLGLTVGTKIGKAVKRNRVRRRLYEIYRLCGPNIKAGFDIVIVARVPAAEAAYAELERDVRFLLKKAGILVENDK